MSDPAPRLPSGEGLPYPYANPNANPYGGPAVRDGTVPGVLAVTAAATVTAVAVLYAALVGHADRTGAGAPDLLTGAWALSSLLLLPAFLFGWVAGSYWLFRARTNADLLYPDADHARRSGWAWGGWVCPVVSLWFPYRVVGDVAKAPGGWRPARPGIVAWWWAAWLVSLVTQRILVHAANKAAVRPGAQDGLVAGAWIWVGLLVVTLLLWTLIVRRVTTGQNAAIHGSRPGDARGQHS